MAAKGGIGQLFVGAGKSIPWGAGWPVRQGRHQGRADSIIKKVNERRVIICAEPDKFFGHPVGRQGGIWIFLRSLRAEGASVPVTAAGGGVGQDKARCQVWIIGKLLKVGDIILCRCFLSKQRQQGPFSFAGNQVINQTGKGISPAGIAQPAGDQATADNHLQRREMFFHKADHGKGGQCLTEKVQRKTNQRRLLLGNEILQADGKIGEKDIAVRRLRGLEQVPAVQGRKGRVLIIGELQGNAMLLSGQFDHPVDVGHGPLVTGEVLITLSASQGLHILCNMPQRPPTPGILRLIGVGKEKVQRLDIGIEHPAAQARPPNGPGQERYPRRWLAGLGQGREDEQAVTAFCRGIHS